MVPWTWVPFFSSMVTVSWLSFIKNLWASWKKMNIYVWVQPGNEPKTSLKLATSCIAFACKTKPPPEWDDLMKTRWNPPELTAITKINTGLALCSCYYTFRLRLFRSLSSNLTEAGPTSLLTSTNQSTFKNRRCMQLIPTTEHELTLQV